MSSNPTLSHVSAAVMQDPWLIQPLWLDVIAEIVDSHIAGKAPPTVDRKKSDAAWCQAGIDFIPVYGPIAPKMGLLDNISGGCSVAQLRDALAAALENQDSRCVCFLFDSPGGNSKGGFEFADEIAIARKQTAKPILAHVEGDCASLAYLFASQCDRISMTVGSQAGSIGAYSKFVDRSRMEQNAGMNSVVVRSSPLKGIGADAVTGPQLQHIQARINAMNAMFQSYVMRARPQVDFAARDMAGMFPARSTEQDLPTAIDCGLVDCVTTRDEIIATYGIRGG